MGYIRLLLAISVFQGHAWAVFPPKVYEFSGGVVSVRLFYIISGFLITFVLTQKYSSVKSFYKSRALRLLPTYYFILFLSIATSIIIYFFTSDSFLLGYFEGYKNSLNIYECILLFIPQLTTLFLDLYGFIGIDEKGLFLAKQTWTNVNGYQFLIIPQAWTLGIECWFYIIAPFIVKNRCLSVLFLGVSITIELLVENIIPFANDDPWARRFFLSEMQYFIIGVISCQNKKLLTINNKSLKAIIYISIFLYLVFMEMLNFEIYFLSYVLFAISIPVILDISHKLPFDRITGDLSYPFYLCHWFCIHLLSNLELNLTFPKTCAFVLSIVISLIIILIIEKPFNRIRKNYV